MALAPAFGVPYPGALAGASVAAVVIVTVGCVWFRALRSHSPLA
jgi:hypothetical protein